MTTGRKTKSAPRSGTRPAPASLKWWAAAIAAVLCVIGCRSPHVVVMSEDQVRAFATTTLEVPREDAFAACAEALRQMGYSVALEDPTNGVLRTRRIPARTAMRRDGKEYLRAYEVRITRASERSSVVVAVAVLFEGSVSADESESAAASGTRRTIWRIEEEQSEAARLFATVRQVLAARRADAVR